MTRAEVVTELRKFRNAWEKHTRVGQDMSAAVLAEETVKQLKSRLKHYYSEESRRQAEDWLKVITKRRR